MPHARPAVILLVAMILVCIATALRGQTYADSRTCAGCHREIAASYARTGMARSFFTPAASNTIENYRGEYYHALSDSHYTMSVRDGAYFQRRWQLDLGGKEMNVEELKIDYVMG